MRALRLLLFALSLGAVLPAQQVWNGTGLEPGWGAYCKITASGFNPGGVVLFHPYTGGFTAVTGLPQAVVGWPGVDSGANAILVRDADGDLFVGIHSATNPLSLYQLTLTGSAVTATRAHPIANWGSIVQMAWLPGGDILFAHRGLSRAGFPGKGLAILRLASGVVTSLPSPALPATEHPLAVAVDGMRNVAYMATYVITGGASVGNVYSVPLPNGGGTRIGPLPTLPSGVYQLAVDHLGQVFAGTFTAGTYQIDPTLGTPTQLNTVTQVNAMTLDPVSGELVLASVVAQSAAMFRWSATNGVVSVPGMPPQDAATGITVRSSLLPLGIACPSPLIRTWVVHPNSGGPPRIGNQSFGLATTCTPPALGVMALGLATMPNAPLNLPPLRCVRLDPAMLLGAVVLGPAPQTMVLLPLPATLQPGDVYAQTFHIDPSAQQLHGSVGLRIHLY